MADLSSGSRVRFEVSPSLIVAYMVAVVTDVCASPRKCPDSC